MKVYSNCSQQIMNEIQFKINFYDFQYVNWFYQPQVWYFRIKDLVIKVIYQAPEIVDRLEFLKSLKYNKATIVSPTGPDEDTHINLSKFNMVQVNQNDEIDMNESLINSIFS